MKLLSNRSKNTPPSPIRKLSNLAADAISRGITPLHLNIGQPDVNSPPQFGEGLQATDLGYIPYAPSEGMPKFRKSWAKWVERNLDIETSPEDYIVTMGASEGLVFLFTACCDPNDEVIIFDPTYANYIGFAAQSGVRLVSLLTSLEDGFVLPEDEIIKKHITSRTRAILLCNPNNPTGVTYSEEVIERLLALCRTHGLYLIVDETYRELVFDGMDVQSVLNITTDDPHVVVVDSLSKRFSLCGARIGTLFIPCDELREKILHIAQARLSAPTIEQKGAAYMLDRLPDNFLQGVRDTYQSRRDCLIEGLSKIPEVKTFKPTGAFYTLAKLPVHDAEHFSSFLLSDFHHEGETLFLAPAKGFYQIAGVGRDEVRFAFVLEEEKLKRAATILAAALKEYKNC